MNVFSNFISCMYPEIIRTDSIESLEQDCRFQAVNIDENDEMISRGELQITSDHLIYFIPSKFPTRWPLSSIKTYGFIDHSKFVFELARGRPSGPPVYYAFILTRGSEFKEKIESRISRMALSLPSDEENDGLLGGCTRLSLKRNNNQADLTSQTTNLINNNNNNNNNKTADPKPLNCLDENTRVQFESTRVRVVAQV